MTVASHTGATTPKATYLDPLKDLSPISEAEKASGRTDLLVKIILESQASKNELPASPTSLKRAHSFRVSVDSLMQE